MAKSGLTRAQKTQIEEYALLYRDYLVDPDGRVRIDELLTFERALEKQLKADGVHNVRDKLEAVRDRVKEERKRQFLAASRGKSVATRQ